MNIDRLMDNSWIISALLLIVVIVVLRTLTRYTKKGSSKKIDYTKSYKLRPLVSKNEKVAFYNIDSAIRSMNLFLFTKVRLADIVEASDKQNYTTLFNKIKSKHVDFLVCNHRLEIICVIELDDKSHERQDRKDRDVFVDSILDSVGIPTIRRKYIEEKDIKQAISKYL